MDIEAVDQGSRQFSPVLLDLPRRTATGAAWMAVISAGATLRTRRLQESPAEALLKTVQIYPGNQAHNEGFVFEFKFEQSLVFIPTFAERLRAIRQLSTLKLEQVDELAGLGLGSCSRFENGKNAPSWASIELLARALNLDPNYLLWGEHGSLAARLSELRKRKGFTQVGLAREAGLKQSAVNEIERGHNKCPSEKTLTSLSKALFVGLEQLCPGGIPWRKE